MAARDDDSDDGDEVTLLHAPSSAVNDRIRSCVNAFRQSLSNLDPSLKLAGPASATDINAADEYFSRYCANGTPPELIALFTLCDGEEFSSGGVIGNWALLSARIAVQEHRTLKEMNDAHLFASVRGGPFYWRDCWIPIAQSPTNHFMVIDCSAPIVNDCGELLLLQHDTAMRYRIADGITDFLRRITVGIMDGRIGYDKDIGMFNAETDGFNCVWSDESASAAFRQRRENELQTFDETSLNGLTRID